MLSIELFVKSLWIWIRYHEFAHLKQLKLTQNHFMDLESTQRRKQFQKLMVFNANQFFILKGG